jgi:hypothetical protein
LPTGGFAGWCVHPFDHVDQSGRGVERHPACAAEIREVLVQFCHQRMSLVGDHSHREVA